MSSNLLRLVPLRAGLQVDWTLLAHGVVVLVALGLRLYSLDAMPMHHDESIHAWFGSSFPWRDGSVYRYDPTYHGPFQFAWIALSEGIFGLTDAAVRLPAALFGAGLVALPLLLRERLGTRGALATSIVLCVSPTAVYFSRFAREDSATAFLTLALVIAAFAWLDRPTRGRIALVFAMFALIVATKESSYITAGIAGAFLIAVWIREGSHRRGRGRGARRGRDQGALHSALRATSGSDWLAAGAAFAVIYVLLFTTFFANPAGVTGIVDGLAYWGRQQGVTVHAPFVPWYFYGFMLVAYEVTVLALGVIGIVVALRRRRLFDLYLVWWLGASLVLFSIASERVPWLLLHIVVPLTILAGVGVEALWARGRRGRAGAVVMLALSLAAFVRMGSFIYLTPADPAQLLVYVQTSPDMPAASKRIHEVMERGAAAGLDIAIELDTNSSASWPLAWYLLDASPGAYDMAAEDYTPTADVILVADENLARVTPFLDSYTGERLRLREWWIPGSDAADGLPHYLDASVEEWTRWYVDRVPWSPIGTKFVWLYIRQDLAFAGALAESGGSR